MARAKKSKTKAQVRTWRTPMTDIIEAKKEYMVMTSAGQIPVESDLGLPEFTKYIGEMVNEGTLQLKMEGQIFTCIVSEHQHFAYTIFTRRAFDRMRTNQQFMMQQGQQYAGRQQ